MANEEGLSWQAQLTRLRGHVAEMEKKREVQKRLEHERNEQALGIRLKTDTPEALVQKYHGIHHRADRAARKFYPLPHLEEAMKEITEFGELLRFYDDCMKTFPNVFAPNHKTTIPSVLANLDDLLRGLERQAKQWRDVKAVTDKITFRSRKPSDDAALVSAAKVFSERAHMVPLSIPSDFFAHENEDFWVAEHEGAVVGHFKYWPDGRVVTFAVTPVCELNFPKLVRGILSSFYAAVPALKGMTAARVRVGYAREVRFYTDMGFVRAETTGPSDWIYQREIG